MKESTMTPKTKSEETAREKMFPIAGTPCAIPWSVIAPYERQALLNHDQTLARLEQRGGLSPCEAVAIIEGRRWHRMETSNATQRLRQLVNESRDKQISDLRAKLAEAEKWMEHLPSCPKHILNELNSHKRIKGITDCECGLDNFRKTLKGE